MKALKTVLIIFLFFILFFQFPSISEVKAAVGIPGDANGDGKVDGLDYVIWLNNYNKSVSNGSFSGDFDENGRVDGLDYVIWLINYGNTATPSATGIPAATLTSPPLISPLPTQPQTTGGTVKVATGAYPEIAADKAGNVHLVYSSNGKLRYRKYTVSTKTWGTEQDTGIPQTNSYRNKPAIAVDSENRPHVLGGQGEGSGRYANWNGSQWIINAKGFTRDTSLALDNLDNAYVVERGNYINVYKKTAASSSFIALPQPAVSVENNHVYTDIAANPANNTVFIVYRHGISPKCGSVYSASGGSSWTVSGITGDDAEAPSVTASAGGKVYAVCGGGGAFEWTGSSWSSIGKAVTAGTRHLPVLSCDNSNNLYASAFGGRYNVRKNGAWTGEKTLPSLSGQKIGFARIAGTGSMAYAVWEEGNAVLPENDNSAGNFDIVFGAVDNSGNILK